MPLCFFLRQKVGFVELFSASEVSERLTGSSDLAELDLWLGLLRQTLCQLLTATEIIKASVFSTVAAGLCPSQLLLRPEHSGPDEPDCPLCCIQLRPLFTNSRHCQLRFPRVSTLLNYQCWHCWITFGGTSWSPQCGDLNVFLQGSSAISAPGSCSPLTVRRQPMRTSLKVSH